MPYAPLADALETERLNLRLWSERDAEGYRRLVLEREETRAEREGDEVDPGALLSLDEARAEVTCARENAPARGIHGLTLRRRGDDEFLGYCALVVGRATIDEPELAYELLRSAHGHGYATEAAAAVVDAARSTGRTRLWSTVRTWNTPSLRVLEKLGFRHDHSTTDDKGEIVWNVLDL
ncbi:MAG TPA: GNAT family N-acetyltransferase [Agromyces sp.]